MEITKKLEIAEKEFREAVKKLSDVYTEFKNEKQKQLQIKPKSSHQQQQSSKRTNTFRIPADWRCEGRLWEKHECQGCVKCNEETTVIFDKKKRRICGTCRKDYIKWKKKIKLEAASANGVDKQINKTNI